MRITLAVIFAGAVLTAPILSIQAKAEGCCGVGWHREVAGVVGPCIRNHETVVVTPGVVVADPAPPVIVLDPRRKVCPFGYHLGPEGRECHRN
jgi:hypothetical protein